MVLQLGIPTYHNVHHVIFILSGGKRQCHRLCIKSFFFLNQFVHVKDLYLFRFVLFRAELDLLVPCYRWATCFPPSFSAGTFDSIILNHAQNLHDDTGPRDLLPWEPDNNYISSGAMIHCHLEPHIDDLLGPKWNLARLDTEARNTPSPYDGWSSSWWSSLGHPWPIHWPPPGPARATNDCFKKPD